MDTVITKQILYQTMRTISEMGFRYPGNPSEKKTADFLMEELKKAGLQDVKYEPYDVRCYSVNKQELRVIVQDSVYEIPCFPFWYTCSGNIKTDILNIGSGTDDKWQEKAKGKIVFASGKIIGNWFSTHKYLQLYRMAENAGAKGFIAWVDAPCGMVPRYDEIRESAPVGTIPGLVISKEDGLLVDLLTRGSEESLKIELVSDVTFYTGQSGDVYGFLPGTEDIMIIGTHYDSTYMGAVDNASGNAGWLALARELGKMKGPHPTILFCAHAGHENNVGARHFAKRHEDWIKKAYVLLFLDGFGSSGFSWGDKGMFPTGMDEYRLWHISENAYFLKIALEMTKKYNLYPASYVPLCHWAPDPDLEGQFYERKVPTIMAVGKPIWFHTTEDTPEKIKPDQLYRNFLAHKEMAEILLKADPKMVKANDRQDHEELIKGFLPKDIKEATVGQEDKGILFGIVPQPAKVNETTVFYINTVMNKDAVTLDFIWDFGDGQIHKDIWAKHKYEKPGRYIVRISGTDEKGFKFTAERILWVIK